MPLPKQGTMSSIMKRVLLLSVFLLTAAGAGAGEGETEEKTIEEER